MENLPHLKCSIESHENTIPHFNSTFLAAKFTLMAFRLEELDQTSNLYA